MHPFIPLFDRNIPSYGLCMTFGLALSYTIAYVRSKKCKLDSNNLIIISAAAIGVGLLCAKIMYIVVTYSPSQIIQMLSNSPEILIAQGGLVFYGGLIGGVMAAYTAAKLLKESIDKVIFSVVPCIPLGHAFGRFGCLLAGCCYGFEYSGIGSVPLIIDGRLVETFPVQIVEAVFNLILFVVLLLAARRLKKSALLLLIYLYSYAFIRFCLEFFRGDLIRGVFCGLSTSQWLCIAIVVLCSIYVLVSRAVGRRDRSAVDRYPK